MERRNFFRWLGFVLLGLFALGTTAFAQDAAARVRDRLPQVDALKAQGAVGETNRGYLEARSSLNEQQTQLVEAENADRRELYSLVARRTGQSVAEVGQQRAIRIAEISRPGVWLQDADGDWYRKK
ncbi:MAG: YdbL family protein [Verrucomicrobiota bacterium JB022]|nr:YdbL family protein [Verrucomicrobiota bacterium JB022]